MDYKETLNLPKTQFPMKANLPQREPAFLELWKKMEVYRASLAKNEGREMYVLHDGPPYANGDIHLGTGFNKILKDFVVKYHTMKGYRSPYVPGWDCHGQPIEQQVEKGPGAKKNEISQAEFRNMCRSYALKFVGRQSEQFQRLGVRGDFENPYLTLDHAYEAANIAVFSMLYEKGMIYRGRKPIHWCWYDKTALAEAEIEYSDELSPSIYVKMPLESSFGPLDAFGEPKFVLIWTTTPWTLPANVAIAVHPDIDYAAVKVGGEILVMAEARVEPVMAEAGVTGYEILTTFRGEKMERLVCRQPILGTDSIVILGGFVDIGTGTGCVHIAPGHGEEDYIAALEYNLPAPMPVNEDGILTGEAGRFEGLHIDEANEKIPEWLAEQGLLFHLAKTAHSYPHCWRCHNPVIFRATEQWFVGVDETGLREAALAEIGRVRWIPAWSERRISSMVEERPDWCISRQRSWGVPIPVFYCEKCRETIAERETFKAVEDLFFRDGADAWFTKEASEILPPGFECPKCGGREFRKETDILDVWFESGCSHVGVLRARDELRWPADLYLEGSDQHRGWFQTSLLTSVGSYAKAPYKAVLTHGFLVDGEGRKMSKSLGNVVDPMQEVKTLGADVLRLWAASADYGADIAASEEILQRVADAYRRIRNTFRFLLGNVHDFDPATERVDYEDLNELDRWAMMRLNQLVETVTTAYDEYRFHRVYRSIYDFCVVDMSSFYLDVIKDRLYTFAAGSKERKAGQTVLYDILMALVKMLAPVLSFTCEEVWQLLPQERRGCESVQLCDWPRSDDRFADEKLERDWERLLEVRGEVSKALEEAREAKRIGNSLEASVNLVVSDEMARFLSRYSDLLPALFIVSEVTTAESGEKKPPLAEVRVKSAPGDKCERCWRYQAEVGEDPLHPSLCDRCISALAPG
ncbi:MAG: isoleucine--tRNA ligase [Actinobacteria bacterium]|nr:MAG: isoleucine--tRNA ligase [Actinomycetota bacterium]